MFLGLRTIVYPAPDLDASKQWFTRTLGVAPYFDEPFYVGFAVGGYELGLTPTTDPAAVPVTYWGVADADAALAELLAAGAALRDPLQDVGDGIRLAAVTEPSGCIVGIIENPHFELPVEPARGQGPGR